MRDRFFDTARGKIVAALRRRGGASASDLAREFGLSTNAVRQQFIMLERDNLVEGYSVRRGKTKPTVEYKLTREAEKFFPQLYDRMLNAVLREVRAIGGDAAVEALFTSMARRQSERLKLRTRGRPIADRVSALSDLLRESGVEVQTEPTSNGFRIIEQSCPYSTTVAEHPEVCSVIHLVVRDAVAPQVCQTHSIATGSTDCRFEITAGGDTRPESAADQTGKSPRRFRKVSLSRSTTRRRGPISNSQATHKTSSRT